MTKQSPDGASTVRILHNVTRDHVGRLEGFDGIRDGHRFVEVFTFDTDVTGDVYEYAYRVTNAPPEILNDTERAIEADYRTHRVRSVSVGDIVIVDGAAKTVASFGFKDVDLATVKVHEHCPHAYVRHAQCRDCGATKVVTA